MLFGSVNLVNENIWDKGRLWSDLSPIKRGVQNFVSIQTNYIQTAIVLFWYWNILGKVTKARAMSLERVFKETVDISSRFKKLGSAAAPQDFGISGSGWWPRSPSLQALEVSTSFQALSRSGWKALSGLSNPSTVAHQPKSGLSATAVLPAGGSGPTPPNLVLIW